MKKVKNIILGALLLTASCAPSDKVFESTSFMVETTDFTTPVCYAKFTIVVGEKQKYLISQSGDTIDCSANNTFHFRNDSVVRVDNFGYITTYYK